MLGDYSGESVFLPPSFPVVKKKQNWIGLKISVAAKIVKQMQRCEASSFAGR